MDPFNFAKLTAGNLGVYTSDCSYVGDRCLVAYALQPT